MSPPFARFLPLSVFGLLVIAGCSDREIVGYQIPKAVGTPPATDTVASGAGVGEDTSPLVWTAPAHWQSKPPSAMRRASFDVPMAGGGAADFSITVLSGAAGGVLGNVNRWRGQLSLAPLAEDQLAANTESVFSNGLTFTVVDFASQKQDTPTRLLAAVTQFRGDMWFFKLTGPDIGVAAEKPAFIAFLRTVKTR